MCAWQVHYPGDTPVMTSFVSAVRAHAANMTGLPQPPPLPTPATPLITAVTASSSSPHTLQTVAWRGAAAAVNYNVQYSSSGSSGPWSVLCTACGDDDQTPINVVNYGVNVPIWLRVQAVNGDGVVGGWSPPYYVSAPGVI